MLHSRIFYHPASGPAKGARSVRAVVLPNPQCVVCLTQRARKIGKSATKRREGGGPREEGRAAMALRNVVCLLGKANIAFDAAVECHTAAETHE